MINKKELKNLQSLAMTKSWFDDTNDEITIYRLQDQDVILHQNELRSYITEYTGYLLNNVFNDRNMIFGTEHCQDFKIYFGNNLKGVRNICEDIWNNPEKYYQFDDEDEYYDFLKYLWVNIGGKEFKLSDIACITDENSKITEEYFERLIQYT